MDTSTGMLFALEGLDGAGKTTTAGEIAAILARRGHNATFVGKRRTRYADPYVQAHMDSLAEIIWHRAKHAPAHALGYEHWIHLMAAYFATLSREGIQPLVDSGAVVVMDNWIYKFALRIGVASGTDPQQILERFSGLRPPDRIFYLDVSPGTAAARKRDFSWAETGCTKRARRAGTHDPRPEFITYQTAIRQRYVRLAAELGWEVVPCEGRVVSDIALQIATAIEAGIDRQSVGGGA